jgi:hypothetical protein
VQPARKTDVWPDGSRRLDAEHAGELARAVDEELRRGHHAIALGAVAAAGSPADRAGEMRAACGPAFHRRPEPFSAVDCLSAAADLKPEIAVGVASATSSWPASPETSSTKTSSAAWSLAAVSRGRN